MEAPSIAITLKLRLLHRSASGNNLCPRRCTSRNALEMKGVSQFTTAEDFHDTLAVRNQTSGNQMSGIHSGARTEMRGPPSEVHGEKPFAKLVVVETALGHPAHQRHLTTFETQSDGTAGARLLTLVTLA